MNSIEFNSKTAVLVVSDVHLGASGVEYDDFNRFLTTVHSKISEGALPSLKVLVITGDFFDLCMDSYRDLARENINLEVYDNLIKLQEKGINVIITLGNHEIPTTWWHDRKFISRKNTFTSLFSKEFKADDTYLSFFEDLTFCQYCILQNNKENNLELHLYDRKKYFADNQSSIEIIKLEVPSDMNEKQKILFTHGYQFEPWLALFIASFVWSYNIKSPDILKELNNAIYNDLIKASESEIEKALKRDEVREIYRQRNIEYEDIDVKELKKMIKKNKKADKRRTKIKEKNRRYFKKIYKFLRKDKYSHISHIIFGHTHQDDQESKEGKHIFNAGAWKHVKNAHYIEILSDGEIIPVDFKLN